MSSAVWFLGPERSNNSWRGVWPAAALCRRGHDAHAVCPDGELEAHIEPGDVVLVHGSNQYDGYDPGRRSLPAFLTTIREQVRPRLLIVQWDDDYFALSDIQRGVDQEVNYRAWMRTDVIGAARMCDRIIVTSPSLVKRFAPYNADVRVVPNYIASWVTEIPLPMFLGDRVGWMGAVTLSHTRDWEWALQAPDWPPMRIVSSRPVDEAWFVRHGLIAEHAPPQASLHSFYRGMAEDVCFGVCPLDPALEFNRTRTWVKALEYAALGIASAGSATDEYRRLARELGQPAVARTPMELRQLAWMGRDTFRRRTRSEILRQQVREQLSVEANVERWEDALDLTRVPA